MRIRTCLLVGLVSTALMAPAGAAGTATAAEQGTHSPNLTHVKTLEYGQARPSANVNGGTDIEFATLKVARRDANGKRICKPQKGHPNRCRKNKKGNKLFRKHVRDYALAGSYDNGLHLVDITQPEQATIVGRYDCAIRQGDVQIFSRGKRTYAAYTQDDPYNGDPPHDTSSQCYTEARGLGLYNDDMNAAGTFIVDVSDPYRPKTVSFFSEPRGSHNQTVAPGGNYVYNSNSDLGAKNPQIEVWSIADFSNPHPVYTLSTTTGLSSHDITFSADGTRAYSAAITHTLVIDTTNLAEPTIIGRIADPAVNIHHQSDPVTLGDRTFLIVTDEIAGAAGNAACPGGGLHVYDITGSLERNPVKVGFWNIPSVRTTTGPLDRCTSHVLRLYPEHGLMTIAWYNAGVRVVDISALEGISVGIDEGMGNVGEGMKEIGYHYFENSDTWSAKTNRIEADGSFYLYGNDLNRGLDVFRFDGAAERSADPGTWLTPEQALARANARGVQADAQTGPYCLYRGMRVA